MSHFTLTRSRRGPVYGPVRASSPGEGRIYVGTLYHVGLTNVDLTEKAGLEAKTVHMRLKCPVRDESLFHGVLSVMFGPAQRESGFTFETFSFMDLRKTGGKTNQIHEKKRYDQCCTIGGI